MKYKFSINFFSAVSNDLLSNKLLKILILLTILVNGLGLYFPILGSNDANFYSVVAKHIVISGNWVNLTFGGADWLDKPHLPFWITAFSYKMFGINSFAYILPGFLFNLLGAYYTYKLARHLYSYEVGLLASLIYLSSLHLMLSCIDIRAEAFLLGEIIPACYYWLLYHEALKLRISYLILGAFFTALAMMTKGPFVLITITSGLIAIWTYNHKLSNFIKLKWLLALLLSLIFILPELIVLYLQFDAHPEKVIFGQTHVSGIKFFFLDSQFGRFFNSGPITNGIHHSAAHYFFFIHTFLWAFLPWSIVFIVAIWYIIKTFRLSRDIPENKQDKYNYIYLLGSILPTFILFSLTKFQLDHYTNILIPFAAILCANWIYNKGSRFVTHPLFYVQIGVAFLFVALVIILSILILNGEVFIQSVVGCGIVLALFGIFSRNRYFNKAIVYPVLAINLVFAFTMLVNGKAYSKYDAGYQIANYLNKKPPQLLIDYQLNSSSLEFHSNDPYLRVSDFEGLQKQDRPYYLVVKAEQWNSLVSKLPDAVFLSEFNWIPQDKFIPTLLNKSKRKNSITKLMLFTVPELRESFPFEKYR